MDAFSDKFSWEITWPLKQKTSAGGLLTYLNFFKLLWATFNSLIIRNEGYVLLHFPCVSWIINWSSHCCVFVCFGKWVQRLGICVGIWASWRVMRDIWFLITLDKFSLSIYQNSHSSHKFSEKIHCSVETLNVNLFCMSFAFEFIMCINFRSKYCSF